MWSVPRVPPPPPDLTVVSEPCSTKGTTEAAGPFAQKVATAVQCRSVADKPATTIQASKSFRLRESVMNRWTHTLGGVLCASVSYMSNIR
uniref:Uncharacterized protein n=1 Tax=Medicago truncatula TaxID=3880 RepID=Q2HVU3_MEDTR|nr:hypothetical protein MtrDRAFT_AC148343g10v2 [Medicago truncatula]